MSWDWELYMYGIERPSLRKSGEMNRACVERACWVFSVCACGMLTGSQDDPGTSEQSKHRDTPNDLSYRKMQLAAKDTDTGRDGWFRQKAQVYRVRDYRDLPI